MDLAGQTPRGLMGFEPRSVMGASKVAVQSPVFARCRGLVFVPEIGSYLSYNYPSTLLENCYHVLNEVVLVADK